MRRDAWFYAGLVMLMFKMVPRSDLRRVSGERKQGELYNIYSTLGMVREWRKRQNVSWECKYWSLFPRISRDFDFAQIAFWMLMSLPMGEPSMVAWSQFSLQRPGTARSMTFLVLVSSRIISDLFLVGDPVLLLPIVLYWGLEAYHRGFHPGCRYIDRRHSAHCKVAAPYHVWWDRRAMTRVGPLLHSLWRQDDVLAKEEGRWWTTCREDERKQFFISRKRKHFHLFSAIFYSQTRIN